MLCGFFVPELAGSHLVVFQVLEGYKGWYWRLVSMWYRSRKGVLFFVLFPQPWNISLEFAQPDLIISQWNPKHLVSSSWFLQRFATLIKSNYNCVILYIKEKILNQRYILLHQTITNMLLFWFTCTWSGHFADLGWVKSIFTCSWFICRGPVCPKSVG